MKFFKWLMQPPVLFLVNREMANRFPFDGKLLKVINRYNEVSFPYGEKKDISRHRAELHSRIKETEKLLTDLKSDLTSIEKY